MATSAGSRFVGGLSRVALAALDARHGDTAVALAHYERAIGEWQQAGAWTPLRVTLRTLVELLARAGAWDDAATLYGAVTAASSGAPPFGADADGLRQSASLLRQHLTGTEFRSHAGRGEQMDGGQVVQFALQAIARAATKTPPEGGPIKLSDYLRIYQSHRSPSLTRWVLGPVRHQVVSGNWHSRAVHRCRPRGHRRHGLPAVDAVTAVPDGNPG